MDKKELWAEMVEARCCRCKHFRGKDTPLFKQCAQYVFLPLKFLRTRECYEYEWENKLTKYDFEELG